jgi:hypothetical protein
MAMRETVRSLRVYFILSGLSSLLFAGSVLSVSLQGSDMIGTVIMVICIGFSLVFLYVGVFLKGLLRSAAGRIVTLLYTSAGWTLFAFLLSLLHGFSSGGLVILVVSLLIFWYLLRNVRRLAAQAQVSSSGATPSGSNASNPTG